MRLETFLFAVVILTWACGQGFKRWDISIVYILCQYMCIAVGRISSVRKSPARAGRSGDRIPLGGPPRFL